MTDNKIDNKTPDPLDIHIGIRLKQRRNLVGLTQSGLAEKLGIQYQQIQKYERGLNRVSASALFRLSKILKVPVDFFYDEFSQGDIPSEMKGFAEPSQTPFEGENPMLRKETMNLVRAYYGIKDEGQRKKVFDLIRTMSDEKANA